MPFQKHYTITKRIKKQIQNVHQDVIHGGLSDETLKEFVDNCR